MDFFFKNSSLRLLFLLRVDGLAFFLALLGRASMLLVFQEKEKFGPTLMDMEKALPWLVSVWQMARHCAAREESSCPTPVISLLNLNYQIWNMEKERHVTLAEEVKWRWPTVSEWGSMLVGLLTNVVHLNNQWRTIIYIWTLSRGWVLVIVMVVAGVRTITNAAAWPSIHPNPAQILRSVQIHLNWYRPTQNRFLLPHSAAPRNIKL